MYQMFEKGLAERGFPSNYHKFTFDVTTTSQSGSKGRLDQVVWVRMPLVCVWILCQIRAGHVHHTLRDSVLKQMQATCWEGLWARDLVCCEG